MNQFENFLLDSFGNGVATRELRLSNEEVEYIKMKYPTATLQKEGESPSKDGRYWYQIRLAEPIGKQNAITAKDVAALRAEKERLLKELHEAKKELARLKNELNARKENVNPI